MSWLASGSRRVGRGGSWFSDPQYARVVYRGSVDPGYYDCRLGLRLMRRAP